IRLPMVGSRRRTTVLSPNGTARAGSSSRTGPASGRPVHTWTAGSAAMLLTGPPYDPPPTSRHCNDPAVEQPAVDEQALRRTVTAHLEVDVAEPALLALQVAVAGADRGGGHRDGRRPARRPGPRRRGRAAPGGSRSQRRNSSKVIRPSACAGASRPPARTAAAGRAGSGTGSTARRRPVTAAQVRARSAIDRTSGPPSSTSDVAAGAARGVHHRVDT